MSCTLCELHTTASHVLVPFRGQYKKPKLMFVGIGPGREEDRQGRCFSGPSGELLDQVLAEVGIPPDQVAYDNITHCIPLDSYGNVVDPTEDQILTCSPYLWSVMAAVDPTVVVALGTLALQTITGDKTQFVSDHHGSVEQVQVAGKLRKLVSAFHPASALRQNKLRGIPQSRLDSIVRDVKYAWDHANGVYFLPKWRIINDTDEAIAYIEWMVSLWMAHEIDFAALDTEGPQLILDAKKRRKEGIELVTHDLWDPLKRTVGVSLSCIPRSLNDIHDVEGVFIVMDHPESKVDYQKVSWTLKWAFDDKGQIRIPLSLHNHKYDDQWCRSKHDFKTILYHETMLGSFVYHGKSISHGLGNVAHKVVKFDLWKDAPGDYLNTLPANERSYRNVPLVIIGEYACYDAAATAVLTVAEKELLKNSKQEQIMSILNEASVNFADMEYTGCAINYDKWARHMKEYPEMMDKERSIIMELPMVAAYIWDRQNIWTIKKNGSPRAPDPKFNFNPNSSDQKWELIFRYYNFNFELEDETDDEDEVVVPSTCENNRHVMTLHARDEKYDGTCTCRCYVPGWDTFGQDNEGNRWRTFDYYQAQNFVHYGLDPHKECLDFMLHIRMWSKLRKVYNDYVKKIQNYFRPPEWQIEQGIPGNLRIVSGSYLLHYTKTGRLSTRDFSIHTLPWHCLSGPTRIRLLDGTEPSISELYLRFTNGESEFWTYSLDENERVVPGKIVGVQRTHDQAPLVRVWLDNGEYVDCTSNHEFRTRNRGYVKAGDLTPEDSISPLYLKDDGNGYEMLYDLGTDSFVYTHQRVTNETKGKCPPGWVRHHVDFDKTNNDPRNLQLMEYVEHFKLHSQNASATLHTPQARQRMLDANNACKLLDLNHRVVKIEKLDGLHPVYDLCVEKHSNFVLASGVFVHNSDPRRLFTSRWINQGGLLLSADYSQLEVRVAAALGRDPTLISLYKQGKDVHRYTASQVYRCAENAVTTAMRRYCKTITFRCIYGGGAQSIADETDLSVDEAGRLLANFLEAYGGINQYIKDSHKEVHNNGCVRTPLNRVFYLPDIFEESRSKQSGAERDSQNYKIQSSSSDVTMTAINIVCRAIRETAKYLSYIWAMIHDAIESDIYPGELFSYYHLLQSAMETDVVKMFEDWLCVPLVAEFELGTCWDGALTVKSLDADHMVLKGRRGFYDETMDVMSRAYNFDVSVKKEVYTGTHKGCGGDGEVDALTKVCKKCLVVVNPDTDLDYGETLILRKSYEGESGGNTEVTCDVIWKQKMTACA